MATTYFINSATGPGSGTGLSWEQAFVSWAEMLAVAGSSGTPFTAGDIVYIGNDHTDPNPGAARTIYGVAGRDPVQIISSDDAGGGTTVSYATGNADQIDMTGYLLTLDGSFAFYGVRFLMSAVTVTTQYNEQVTFEDCYFDIGANNAYLYVSNVDHCLPTIIKRCTWDGNAYSSVAACFQHAQDAYAYAQDVTFTGVENYTGTIFAQGAWYVSGCDFTDFDNATLCEVLNDAYFPSVFNNCKLTAAQAAAPISVVYEGVVQLVNCTTDDYPYSLRHRDVWGTLKSSTSITRDSGAAVEGTSVSWIVQTHATDTSEDRVFYTPWIYGTIASTGTKTFSIAVARNYSATPFTDAQVWMEVESMETASSPKSTLRSDHRGGTGSSNANILSSANNQTADATSTWNNLNATNNKMTLAVTGVSVQQAGLFRARVCVGIAGLVFDTDELVIDPKVTVS